MRLDPIKFLSKHFPDRFSDLWDGDRLGYVQAIKKIFMGHPKLPKPLARGRGTTTILSGMCVWAYIHGLDPKDLLTKLSRQELGAVLGGSKCFVGWMAMEMGLYFKKIQSMYVERKDG